METAIVSIHIETTERYSFDCPYCGYELDLEVEMEPVMKCPGCDEMFATD